MGFKFIGLADPGQVGLLQECIELKASADFQSRFGIRSEVCFFLLI